MNGFNASPLIANFHGGFSSYDQNSQFWYFLVKQTYSWLEKMDHQFIQYTNLMLSFLASCQFTKYLLYSKDPDMS